MSVASRSDAEEVILNWCNQRLRPDEPVTRETDLLSEGYLDSLVVLDLLVYIENQFGVVIDNAAISPQNLRSVRSLAALAAGASRRDDSRQ